MLQEKKKEPMFFQDVRIRMLEETGIPGRVEAFDESNPIEFIKRVRPQVHCTGIEYKGRCVEEAICKELGIELVYVPRVGNWSSSKMRKDGHSSDSL